MTRLSGSDRVVCSGKTADRPDPHMMVENQEFFSNDERRFYRRGLTSTGSPVWVPSYGPYLEKIISLLYAWREAEQEVERNEYGLDTHGLVPSSNNLRVAKVESERILRSLETLSNDFFGFRPVENPFTEQRRRLMAHFEDESVTIAFIVAEMSGRDEDRWRIQCRDLSTMRLTEIARGRTPEEAVDSAIAKHPK